MSLTVRHLNGDSTFLLLFSPELQPQDSDLTSANGAYSVLIDPWITGSSIVSAKWFAVTDRVEPSSISHLSELEEPDVVICSQNKSDHTHKETLLQLRPEGKTVIAAEPGAAKAIKSWNHFDPNRIHSLNKYDHKAKFGNSLRLYIPPLSPEGLPGEVAISFIPAKNYVTGLHNAIGITYQPPTKTKAMASVTTIDLPRTKYFHIPRNIDSILGTSVPEPSHTNPDHQLEALNSQDTTESLETADPQETDNSRVTAGSQETAHTQTTVDSQETVGSQEPTDSQDVTEVVQITRQRTQGHRPQLSRSSNTASSELLSFPQRPSIRPSMEDLQDSESALHPVFAPHLGSQATTNDALTFIRTLPTPPDSPNRWLHESTSASNPTDTFTPKSSISTLNNSTLSQCAQDSRTLSVVKKPLVVHPARPKAISVLYTPHGISKPDLKPYVQHHLTRLPGALPLTLLLHSFDSQQNPWFLGGNVMAGAIGGIEIAKSLMARCWISAHDEQKDDRGMAVKLIKTERMTAEEIRRELARDEWGKGYGWTCDVRRLPCGRDLVLSSSERDLLVGSAFEGTKQGLGLQDTLLVQGIAAGPGE